MPEEVGRFRLDASPRRCSDDVRIRRSARARAVEHNKPATFGHPFYSLAADYRMTFLMMAGRMEEEVAKYVSVSS